MLGNPLRSSSLGEEKGAEHPQCLPHKGAEAGTQRGGDHLYPKSPALQRQRPMGFIAIVSTQESD